MSKFGTIAWQDEMMDRIGKKLAADQKLDPFEAAFLEVQKDHNARLAEGF